jgi:hypothetical protein
MGAGLLSVESGFILFTKIYQYLYQYLTYQYRCVWVCGFVYDYISCFFIMNQ